MVDALHIPEMTVAEFADHMMEGDFHLRFGNPVLVHGKNGHDLVCMAWEYYERLTQQFARIEDDRNIKYWIYEFQMPEKVKQELEALCALHELTPDEFLESAVENALQQAEADPEGYRKQCLEEEKTTDIDIHLVRYYPVYKGETEAQAYRRKLAEEAAEKQDADGPLGENDNVEGGSVS